MTAPSTTTPLKVGLYARGSTLIFLLELQLVAKRAENDNKTAFSGKRKYTVHI